MILTPPSRLNTIVDFYGPLKIKQILSETFSTIMHYVQDIRDGQLK